MANINPNRLLKGEKPLLLDEFQDALEIWGAVRKSVDDLKQTGLYILIGSTSKHNTFAHTRTLRISRLEMNTMSLYESNESNGSVSLSNLFNHKNSYISSKSDLTFDNLIFAICREVDHKV